MKEFDNKKDRKIDGFGLEEKLHFIKPKLIYVQPKLVKHGDISELTKGFIGTFIGGGGS